MSDLDLAALRRQVRPSPCPGLFRIVPTGDGGVCRVKTRCGRLTAAQLRAVADAAAQWGSGVIEATNRGNLQIRGVGPTQEEPLIAALLAAGLGPKDSCDLAGADDLRNVMINPISGRDPWEGIDCAPIAEDLLTALAAATPLHALSPKTAILLDGGGPSVAADHRHDLWLSAVTRPDESRLFAFGLSGGPCFDAPIGVAAPERAVAVILDCLGLYAAAATADPGLKRFRHWTGSLDRAGLARALGLEDASSLAMQRRLKPKRASLIGVHPQRQAGLVLVGGVAPLGRLDPAALNAVAAAAERFSAGALILTPWRGVVLPDVAAAQAGAAVAALAAAGLATRASDPLAHMVACSGSRGCASALADTLTDGAALAAALAGGSTPTPDLHLTGCPKSCASARVADVTLAAVAPGRYDLYRRDPTLTGFGRRDGAGLTVSEIAAALR